MNILFDNQMVRSMVFYPRMARPHYTETPTGPISDGTITADGRIVLGYRLYRHSATAPLIVYFHGNAETAPEHNGVAALYAKIGLSLLVIDFRGYGWSTGQANISTLLTDMTGIYAAMPDLMQRHDIPMAPLFLMGRSLGTGCAIHMAHDYPDGFRGLIVESGFTELLKLSIVPDAFTKLAEPINSLQKMHDVQLPLLVIHGERDTLIPVEHGQALYDASPATIKRIARIARAGHNDLLVFGISTYFDAIEQFVTDVLAKPTG